jgi:hypothetical protein
MKNLKRLLILFLLFVPTAGNLLAQDSIVVRMRGNVCKDKIQLRWAAANSSSWAYTNKNGFMLERYTLVRNGEVLSEPEKKVLTPQPLKAKPLDDWEAIVQNNQYAAIIAQALYGEDFETSSSKAGIGGIIARSKEREQRFGFSLYAAELSFEAALFAGWGVEDTDVKKGERYLYRLMPVKSKENIVAESTSVYLSLDEYEPLPKPMGLTAVFGDKTVLLVWDYASLSEYYPAYHIERSENKTDFVRISKDLPVTNISGEDRIFFTDTIENDKMYCYRIVGVTSFDQTGEPSEVIEGQGRTRLIYVPHITHAIPNEKGEIEVFWEFDQRGNKDITSFELNSAPNVDATYETVIKNIAPEKRSIIYDKPLMTAYYTISAIAKYGEPTVSFPNLIQLEDSIPPVVPTGLEGEIDTLGIVHLKWNANKEGDLLGYKIFRGQIKGEEVVPLNDIVWQDTVFIDSVQIYSLNPNTYYSVAAVDKRQNQSPMCSIVELKKPEVVPPSSPIFTKFETKEDGHYLEWVTGNEEGIKIALYRYKGKDGEKQLLYMVEKDSNINSYLDDKLEEGVIYYYEVSAMKNENLVSEPSPRVSLKAKMKEVSKNDSEKTIEFKAKREEGGVLLRWEYNVTKIRSLSIYRKKTDEEFALWYQPAALTEQKFLDGDAEKNTVYEYMLVIKLDTGKVITANAKISK